MEEPDQPREDGDRDDAPEPPPSAFGLAAGCPIVAGLGFAAFLAPFVFNAPGSSGCVDIGDECVPVGQDLAANLAVTATLGLGFAAATAALVRGRLRAWREGRRVRPPLWVAFVALFAIGCMAASLAMAPIQWLFAAMG